MVAPGDLLPVDAHPSPPRARRIGLAVLGASVVGLLAAAALARRESKPEPDARARAARGLNGAAALLAGSVLADSSVEHYRGAFENPGMYAPLAVASATLLVNGGAFQSPGARTPVHLIAVAVGAAGTAFHVYNLLRREGGLRWVNLFYGAPLGAPAALSLAGLLGLAADQVRGSDTGQAPELLGLPAGQALAGLIGTGMAATAGEAWLFHFRGAFHNPFMWLPVTMPPVASALLVQSALVPNEEVPITSGWLGATALMGFAGVGFHIYGVSRNMGGWYNWSQNLLAGPPIPAPPSFTALAIAGLSALSLIGQARD